VTCERCGERDGEIHYTEYVDGEMRRSLICRTCAEELGFGEVPQHPEAGAPAGQILGIVKISEILEGKVPAPPDSRSCARCGATADDLDENSLFGCPTCYEAFEGSLEALFRRVHGRVRHRGRIPGGFVEGPPAEGEGPDPGEGGAEDSEAESGGGASEEPE
jgi:protein arginine kinase activator